MFEVGDKVVHPSRGAGTIAAVEQKDMLDDFNRYYVIDLAAEDMRLMVPVRMAEEIGLRRISGEKGSKAIIEVLASLADDLPDDFKARQAQLQERLKEGDPMTLAAVVRDMAARSLIKTYSPTESRLYDQARSMLSGELALARNTDVNAALGFIDEIVAGGEKKA